MNAKSLLASAALLLAAGAALAADDQSEAAQDAAFRNGASAHSTLTRAEVRAQTIAARQAGLLDTNEAYQDPAYMTPRLKSAEVKAQLAARPAKDSNNTAH